MNLALFPITALLLLLSGVGTPVHAADGRPSATALFNAILANCAEARTQRRSSAGPLRLDAFATPRSAFADGRFFPAWRDGLLPSTEVSDALAGLRRGSSRKPYRERFGFAEGALQPKGPPSRPARSLLG